jgi:NitT/TauT family transport system ATP-binding protein
MTTATAAEPATGGRLDIRAVSKVYGGRSGDVLALDQCSLQIEAGQLLAIVGPSGCGKTTLLNIIAGFESLTSGSVLLDDRVIAEPGRVAKPDEHRIVVFQQGALFPWKTLLDNVAYGPMVQKRLTAKQARSEARALLESAGLGRRADVFPNQLSSGLRRVAEVLRALINQPRVLLLDEPFRALDTTSKSSMHERLLALLDDHPTTVFFVTHDIDEAVRLADRVVVMDARPGRFTRDVTIPLPRGRLPRDRGAAELRSVRETLLTSVRAAARTGFLTGVAEGAA